MQKIYLLEEDCHDQWESYGTKLLGAWKNLDKIKIIKEQYEKYETIREDQSKICDNCRFSRCTDYIKNLKTYNRRAKKFCKQADFQFENDDYEYYSCISACDPYLSYSYNIKETELCDD